MKRKIIISSVFSIALLAGVYLFFYYQRRAENERLTSSFSRTETLYDITFSPSFPNPFEALNGKGILAVSTGDISRVKLRSRSTGEIIAEASVLKTLTKDSNGKIKELHLIVQILTLISPIRSITPWITQKASELISIVEFDDIESDENLRQLFFKGSKWIFIPLVSLLPEETAKFIPDYAYYSERYYDDSDDFSLFIETGLRNLPKDPILLLDVFYLFGD